MLMCPTTANGSQAIDGRDHVAEGVLHLGKRLEFERGARPSRTIIVSDAVPKNTILCSMQDGLEKAAKLPLMCFRVGNELHLSDSQEPALAASPAVVYLPRTYRPRRNGNGDGRGLCGSLPLAILRLFRVGPSVSARH